MHALLTRIFLSLLLVSTFSVATAQGTAQPDSDQPSPFASGIGSTATHLDARGTPVLEITVTGVERDWQGYGRYSEPQAGSDYTLVHIAVTNLGSRVYVIDPYDFELVDSLGVAETRAWVSNGGGLLTEDTTIGGGETIEGAIVFEVFSDLDPLMLLWSPEYRVYVFIHLGS